MQNTQIGSKIILPKACEKRFYKDIKNVLWEKRLLIKKS